MSYHNDELNEKEISRLVKESERLDLEEVYTRYTVKVNYQLIMSGKRNLKYYRRLARAYKSIGKPKSATKVYERILINFPDDEEAKAFIKTNSNKETEVTDSDDMSSATYYKRSKYTASESINSTKDNLVKGKETTSSRSFVMSTLYGLSFILGLFIFLVFLSNPSDSPSSNNEGYYDRDCSDFSSGWAAQRFYIENGPGDPHGLDRDNDGNACDWK